MKLKRPASEYVLAKVENTAYGKVYVFFNKKLKYNIRLTEQYVKGVASTPERALQFFLEGKVDDKKV